MDSIKNQFNKLDFQSRLEEIHDCGYFVYRIDGIHYLVDIYSYFNEFVVVATHKGSSRMAVIELITYKQLDDYIYDIEIPWKAKKK